MSINALTAESTALTAAWLWAACAGAATANDARGTASVAPARADRPRAQPGLRVRYRKHAAASELDTCDHVQRGAALSCLLRGYAWNTQCWPGGAEAAWLPGGVQQARTAEGPPRLLWRRLPPLSHSSHRAADGHAHARPALERCCQGRTRHRGARHKLGHGCEQVGVGSAQQEARAGRGRPCLDSEQQGAARFHNVGGELDAGAACTGQDKSNEPVQQQGSVRLSGVRSAALFGTPVL